MSNGRWTRKQPGRCFHGGDIDYRQTTKVRGIPVTGPSRTLLDLGQVVDEDELERALRTAEQLRLTDVVSVVDLLERYPRRRGSGAIRRLTDVRELYQFLARTGLPDPEWNVLVELDQATLEVDLLQTAGWTPVRVTWRALRDDPSLPGDLRALLSR